MNNMKIFQDGLIKVYENDRQEQCKQILKRGGLNARGIYR